MNKINNPFITNGYAGKEYFCDRTKETKLLLHNIENNLSTTLIALRRIGKTGLVKHVLTQLPKDVIPVYLDIFPTENLNDFSETLTTSIINAIPSKHTAGKKIMEFIQSLRPTISFDPLSGTPQVEFKNQQEKSKENISSIFSFLEKFNKKIVIVIDEFQQILNYPEKNTDSYLRTIMQQLNNITFIFTGSHQHLMENLFNDPAKPFYRSTQLLSLDKIDKNEYIKFIKKKFNKANKEISEEVIKQMLEWTETYTYYVQLLCNKVFAASNNLATDTIWKSQALSLLKEQQNIFLRYRDLLTKQQWKLLKSIAIENEINSPTSKTFISKHSLGSPATVLRSLLALQKKELIYMNYDSEGNKQYSVYDLFLKRWLNNI
jgi:uncharacterized protein